MKRILLFLFLIYANNAFAIFCPANFNSVNIGDSIEQVIQICGNPSGRNQHKKNADMPQEWIYYMRSNMIDQGNTKLSITFNPNNQAINIEITNNGLINTACEPIALMANSAEMEANCRAVQGPQNVSSTKICGENIQLGDSKETVESACGRPSFVNQSHEELKSSDIVELRYDNVTPPATLYFENGQLVDRQYQ